MLENLIQDPAKVILLFECRKKTSIIFLYVFISILFVLLYHKEKNANYLVLT